MKLIAVITFLTLLSCASPPKSASPSTPQPPQKTSGTAEVNGLKLYYEVHGSASGTPLVLLHGGGSSIDITYSKTLPYLSAKRKVIAVDEQAHGRSGDRPGPVTFEGSADDVAALLKSLNIPTADVMGFSNGASVALQLAIRHPQLVRKLVFVSSFTKKSGAHPNFWQFLKTTNFEGMPQSLKDMNLKLYSDPQKLRVMHDKDLARMRNFKDVPDKLVKAITVPTLLVAGDRDVVKPEHVIEMNKMMKESRIFILPGGHGHFLGEITSPAEFEVPGATAAIINDFLSTP